MRRRLIPLLALTTATIGTVLAGPAHADINAFATVMNGAQEQPGPGDTDAIGTALVVANSATGEVCVRIRARNIDPASAAHIHLGGPTVAGPVVIGLTAPSASGSSSSCVIADKALVQGIIDNPGQYYVNVHNPAFPGGSLRGQLG